MQYPHALAAGAMVAGEFRIVRALGDDGFCLTYEAVDAQLDRRVTLQEYFPAGIAQRSAGGSVRPETIRQVGLLAWGRKRFVEDAQRLAKLDHPAIARVRRVLEDNNTAYALSDFEDEIGRASCRERV